MENNNLPSVNVDTFTKIVEMQFKEGNMRPIFGLGKGGIGKTESIMNLAKNKLKIGYIDIRLLLYSETDLKGIPYPNNEHSKTIWLQNNILPTIEKDGEYGILVLDEITSCLKSTRTAAYQLLNERRLGEYVLPDNWLIVCLGNGEDDGGDYNGIEGNFANRCSVFNVVADVESWKKWALKNNINPLVVSYISWKPCDLHSYNPDNDSEILFASPRSWFAVSSILNKYTNIDVDDTILQYRVEANLGRVVGQQFLAFCKYKEQTIDPMEILLHGSKPNIEKQEILYITISSVIKLVGEAILNDLKSLNKQCTVETVIKTANAVRWILSLKKEYAVMGFKDLISYDEDSIVKVLLSPNFLVSCPELKEFAKNNIDIFK